MMNVAHYVLSMLLVFQTNNSNFPATNPFPMGLPEASTKMLTAAIQVEGNGQSITNGATTPNTADDTDFGIVALGASDTHTFTIRNSGTSDLMISNISLLGHTEFSLASSLTFPITLAMGATQDFDITFAPTSCAVLNFSAVVSIGNDDPDDHPFEFVVGGKVEDLVAPTPVCQNVTTALSYMGGAAISVADIDGGSSDNCSFSMVLSRQGFDCSEVGTHTVTLTATDKGGNSASCNASVTVVDNLPPVIENQTDITVNNDAGTCGAIVTFSTPSHSPLMVNTGTLTGGPSLATSGGSTNWIAVAYNPLEDLYYSFRGGNTGMPFRTYNSAGTQLVNNTTGFDFRGLWWNPNTDELQGNGHDEFGYRTVALDANSYATNGGTTFVTGLHQPNVQSQGAYDFHHNEIIFYHNQVLYQYDLQGNQLAATPITNFPESSSGDITTRSVGYTGISGKEIAIYSELNARVYFLDKATATYNGDFLAMPAGAPTPNNYGFAYVNGYIFLREDESNDPWESYLVVIDEQLDNCDGVTVSQTGGLASGSLFPIGTTTIEFTATDAAGNTTTATFNIVVNDAKAPTAVCQNITAQLDNTGNVSISENDVDNGSSDNCSGATLALDVTAFDCSHRGSNTVTLTITDASNNMDNCTATVTVEDNANPTAVCQDITIRLDNANSATISENDIDNGSSDNCTLASLALDNNTFGCNDVGNQTITLTATDNAGNMATCMATVTVLESREIDVLGNGISIISGDTSPDIADFTDFGQVETLRNVCACPKTA